MTPYNPDHPDYPSPPKDCDGGEVTLRCGGKLRAAEYHDWKHADHAPSVDIIAYTARTPEVEREAIALALINEARRFSGRASVNALSDLPEHHYRDQLRYADAILALPMFASPSTDAARHLSNLLAIIHRDGGQYQDAHGTEKAVADAIELSASRIVESTDVARMREAVEAAYREGHQEGRLGASCMEENSDWLRSKACTALQPAEGSDGE